VGEQLANKPLVEAIFELRWNLRQVSSGLHSDPHWAILPGQLYERLSARYPSHEQLPAALVPSGMGAYIVQHRFRPGPNEWPLVQIGPGVLSVNDTAGYVWDDFETRASEAVASLIEAHPELDAIGIKSVSLRYINAEPLVETRPAEFMKELLGVSVSVPSSLYEDVDVSSDPVGVDIRLTYESSSPKGIAQLRLANGQREGIDSMIWELVVSAVGDDCPPAAQVPNWISDSHVIIDDWFFKLVAGELLRRYR
jgi:uncharacterized protein (TIGR04255 family)